MAENKICKGCKFNNYPICSGTKVYDGSMMNIENLRPGFSCGQKDLELMSDYSQLKTFDQLRLERIESLEARIKILEELKGGLS